MSGSVRARRTDAARGAEALERLRERLRTAAADAFAQISDEALGGSLREAVAACIEAGLGDPQLLALARDLETFDRLGRHDRSVVVARGMRIAAWLQRSAPGDRPHPRTPSKRHAPASKRVTPAAVEKGTAPTSAGPAADREPASVRALAGVGPAIARKLEARGIRTIVDLLYLLPTGYRDRRVRKPLDELADGDVAVVEGETGALRQGFARGRFMATLQLRADDGRGGVRPVVLRWFHRMGGLQALAGGRRIVAIGPVREYRGQLTMAHPEVHPAGEPGPAIGVRYPAVEGIPAGTLARIIGRAVDRIDDPATGFVDALPGAIAAAEGLPSQADALRTLHRPPDDLDPAAVEALDRGVSPAHRRLAFDEFFFVQLLLLQQRARLRARPSRITVEPDSSDEERWRACLPFEPTAAQIRVVREIEHDLGSGAPMLRLLQGDVGSGKTAVAFAAALMVTRNGGQVAFMAPTEILAEQHMRTLEPWCAAAGLRIAILTGATGRARRNSLLALLRAGQLDIVVGTHALLVEDVAFDALGLCVIDEQHRFGVEQRALLRSKGAVPHLLVMTATPIPRTLALCAYGELEVSVIDELPPGRTPVKTELLTGKRGLERARRMVAERVRQGHQAFVVCPLVEASDALDVTDVEATAAALRALMPEHRIALVHGRLPSRDKDAVMQAFRARQADLLVATTVIEVGVDVPSATVMLVEHAERFGLAQLHQLRGRVGRGGGTSWCLLHTASGPSSEPARRLAILTETTDGFLVAERDLALRGPGEVFGTRQSGVPRLRFAGFAGEGTRLLVAARAAAQALLDRDPLLHHHPEVAAELRRRSAEREIVTPDSG